MYKFLKLLLIVCIAVFVAGCSFKRQEAVKGSEKIFAQEDLYIMRALYFEQKKKYDNASIVFQKLYEETEKKEYLYRSLHNDLAANKNKRAVARVDTILGEKVDDFTLTRIKVRALLQEKRVLEAKELALRLVEASRSVKDYLLVSDIYVKLKQFENAIKYLESAYVQEYDERILEKMAVVLYVNLNRKKDAIAQLETHSRIHGCSRFICSKLIGFYSNDNNIEGLLSTYLRIYKIDKSKSVAEKIVQIYGYKQDYSAMTAFLQESGVDNALLLELYIRMKKYENAAKTAQELYEESGDIRFLGQSAIFEYESSKNKDDKAMQKSIIQKLQRVLQIKKEPMYLNYLGYLLIDHEIDVKKGMNYIREALEKEPESVYYLDSLAWGYYKLHKCKKAWEIMQKVIRMDGSSNEEVKEHIEAIKACLKKQKDAVKK